MDETLIPDNAQGEIALLATARLLPNVEAVKVVDMVTNEAEKNFQDSFTALIFCLICNNW